TAEDGVSALKAINAALPDLVLLDVQMPGMDGYEVCGRIKSNPASRLVPVVMITALDRTADRVRALESGADDYMTKPVDRIELVARVGSALRLKAVYDSLDSAEHVIFALAAAGRRRIRTPRPTRSESPSRRAGSAPAWDSPPPTWKPCTEADSSTTSARSASPMRSCSSRDRLTLRR